MVVLTADLLQVCGSTGNRTKSPTLFASWGSSLSSSSSSSGFCLQVLFLLGIPSDGFFMLGFLVFFQSCCFFFRLPFVVLLTPPSLTCSTNQLTDSQINVCLQYLFIVIYKLKSFSFCHGEHFGAVLVFFLRVICCQGGFKRFCWFDS